MAMRYYRKMGTSPVPIADGRSVVFKSLDGQQGFLATEDPSLWSAFELAMKQGRSALTEISWAEFDVQYVQKKSSGQISKPPWREEIYKGMVTPSPSTLQARLQALPAAVAAEPTPAPAVSQSPTALIEASQAAANKQIAKELPKASDYKPEVGRRRKAKPA